jgi:hypothetical protein
MLPTQIESRIVRSQRTISLVLRTRLYESEFILSRRVGRYGGERLTYQH